MLVLSRKECEEIIIDGNIRLRIIRVQGNRVRIGIDAPDGVPVLRAEIAGPPECDQRAAASHAVETVCC